MRQRPYRLMEMVLIIILSFLFVAGALVCLSSLASYAGYVATEGNVMDFLRCNTDNELTVEEEESAETDGAVVVYTVNGEIYRLVTEHKKAWKKPGAASQVKVLYNPFDPQDARIKEGTPFLGAILMAVSFFSIILLIVY